MDKDQRKEMIEDYEVYMSGRYRQLYTTYGGVEDKKGSGNVSCPNKTGHLGDDLHPSMSVNNETGGFNCFTCGEKGYFTQFFYKYIKGDIIEFIEKTSPLKKSHYDESDAMIRQQDKEYASILTIIEKNRPTFESSNKYSEDSEDVITIPNGFEIVQECCERLHNTPSALAYWLRNRGVEEHYLKLLHIGLDESGAFTIPLITANGEVLNIKHYNPIASNKADKWVYPFIGFPTNAPIPRDNFSYPRIVLVEGEPDMIMGFGNGIEGIATLGSCSNVDVDKVFGKANAEQVFLNKDVVIVFDSDQAGIEGAYKLAKNIYQYAKQIKIINLDKSEINPKGLDPEVINERGKRVETDLTDWFRKNGFTPETLREFWGVVDATDSFILDEDRAAVKRHKISISEAQKSRYYTMDGSKEIEMMAQISSIDGVPFNIPSKLRFSCPKLKDPEYNNPCCRECDITGRKEFTGKPVKSFDIEISIGYSEEDAEGSVTMKPNDILGIVNKKREQMYDNLKTSLKISRRCQRVELNDIEQVRISLMTVVNSTTGYKDSGKSMNDDSEDIASSALVDSEIEVFVVHDHRNMVNLEVNKPYKVIGHVTKSWDYSYNVVFAKRIDPMETSMDRFKIDKKMHDHLKQVFQPKEWTKKSVSEALEYRYDAFSGAAGLTGRNNLFFINDLAFFSQIQVNNKDILPGDTRGWVEVFIIGDSRCGKSVATNFLHRHYQFGEIIGSSSAMSRAGIIGGVTRTSSGRNSLSWGKVPKNNGGLVTFDETSSIDLNLLRDMTDMRSGGVASVNMVASGSAYARTRKIFLSNTRSQKFGYGSNVGGVPVLQDLFGEDAVITRFDFGTLVRASDVDMTKIESRYTPISIEFNSQSCQNLLRYSATRNPRLVRYEQGFNDAVQDAAIRMSKKYSETTYLPNMEIRGRFLRCANAMAGILYSVDDDDIETLVVRNCFVEYLEKMFDQEFKGNLQFDDYTRMERDSKALGDVEFTKAFITPLILKTLLRETEFTEADIRRLFSNYLLGVQSGVKYLYDPDMGTRQTAIRTQDAAVIFFNSLLMTKCFKLAGRKYMKTAAFGEWLKAYYKVVGDDFVPNGSLDVKAFDGSGANGEAGDKSAFAAFDGK